MLLSSKAIVLDEKDNVATETTDLVKGNTIVVHVDDHTIDTVLVQNIPFGHKFALNNIPKGGLVLKYGEIIGKATESIRKGELVHIHNVEGMRGRGDQK